MSEKFKLVDQTDQEKKSACGGCFYEHVACNAKECSKDENLDKVWKEVKDDRSGKE